jgi:hypothetical protein
MNAPVTFREFTRVDGRCCFRCGARAGGCDHITDETETVVLSVRNQTEHPHKSWWSKFEINRLRDLRAMGLTARETAELMNKTEDAIKGQSFRLGL